MKKTLIISLLVIFSISIFAQENHIVESENLSLIQKVEKWYEAHTNYGTITFLMIIESSFIPFPSEIVIPPAAYIASKPESSLNIFLVVLFGTIGALIGALINYYLSLWLGRIVIYKFADSRLGHLFLLDSEKIKKSEAYFNEKGKVSTFIGRFIPGIRQLISIPAGLAKMNIFSFMIFTFLGAGVWNIVLAILGYIAQGQQDMINKYNDELSMIILVIVALVVMYFIIKFFLKKRKKTRLFGLIGKPLVHSFSKDYFARKFTAEKIDAQYLNFELPSIEDFRNLIKDNELSGLNVTIPYKQQVIPYLDDLSEEAREIGAVNVIKFADGKLIGYNSDVYGFCESIRPLLKPFHKKALVLGTGGASKAVNYGLKKLGLEVMFVSRTVKEGCITYEQITQELLNEYTVIVNCTPLGTFPKTEGYANIPYHFLSEKHLLYDLVYNPAKTKFLEFGEKQGALIKNGAEMLEKQAIKAWEIWNK